MEGGTGEVGSGHVREPIDDGVAGGAEVVEDFGDRAIVVGGFVRFSVLEIGGMQLGGAGVVIVETLVPERFEVEEMAGVFLDGPFSVGAVREDFRRQVAHGGGEAFRCASQSLEKGGRSP